MKFEYPTEVGTIIKRYKRFLVDVELKGEVITAHLANTGSMKTCWEPGWKVLLSYHDDPKRKLKYSVEMIHNGLTWIGVNTSAANKIVKQALQENKVQSFESYKNIKAEHKFGDSRIDFFLSGHINDQPDCYLEVKSVTLKGSHNEALFPDAISTRGQKHLEELIKIKQKGFRAIIFFLIQRQDVNHFQIADYIDPEYARLLVKASEAGVEIHCYQCSLNKTEIKIHNQLTYRLPDLSQESLARTQCQRLASHWEFMPEFNPNTTQDLKISIPKDNHIIFYGGSFNPWHNGHLQCLKLLNKDSNVFVIPDNNPRKKLSSTKNPLQRYKELKEQIPSSIQVYPGFWAKNKANPTANWLPEIKKRFPNVSLSLLIGFDSFMTIDKWIEAQKLLQSLSSLYIVSRLDDLNQKQTQIKRLSELAPQLKLIFLGNHDYENISSTKLRKKKKNKNID